MKFLICVCIARQLTFWQNVKIGMSQQINALMFFLFSCRFLFFVFLFWKLSKSAFTSTFAVIVHLYFADWYQQLYSSLSYLKWWCRWIALTVTQPVFRLWGHSSHAWIATQPGIKIKKMLSSCQQSQHNQSKSYHTSCKCTDRQTCAAWTWTSFRVILNVNSWLCFLFFLFFKTFFQLRSTQTTKNKNEI